MADSHPSTTDARNALGTAGSRSRGKQRLRLSLVLFALLATHALPLYLWLFDGEAVVEGAVGIWQRLAVAVARGEQAEPKAQVTVRPRLVPTPTFDDVLGGIGDQVHPTPTAGPISVFAAGADTEMLSAIRRWSRYYQVDVGFALCVARHESSFDALAVGDDGDAVGLYQFLLPTWQMFRKKMGLPQDDHRLDVDENVKTAMWAFANGYRRHWAVVKKSLCP